MPLSKDPFDESVNDVRELVARAKSLQESVRSKGIVDRDVLEEVRRVLDAADEELGLLNNVLQVIEQRNGRVGDQVFSVNEVLRRQGVVRELAAELKGVRSFRDSVEARVVETEKAFSSASFADDHANDAFMLRQEQTQRQVHMEQDLILDRLSVGLRELRETGVNVNDELQQQEILLEEAHQNVEGVQARLRVVNAKVDKLLASMSNRRKICTIVILIVVLVILASVLFG
ncbi:syntaxin [Trypanosoma rangeli]|uniref:Syntaxin n=1 Tax=Trypanosoma rangeli TaxID=5698 RepID=A0A3R7M3G3_TRYRA|nr:syntaxin [Trypanosoma rangeli]RNE98707.1 syntaxin [Trypanosoma rangeli]|eukprot:RNE98707.1 syntaxin [Trypanosoma rangeli]